jgi:hypothetical protein
VLRQQASSQQHHGANSIIAAFAKHDYCTPRPLTQPWLALRMSC